MAQNLQDSFNPEASQIVSMKEWKQKTFALYKSELTIAEKLYLNCIDKPLSATFGLFSGIKAAMQGEKREGVFFDPVERRIYASGACLKSIVKDMEAIHFRPKFQAKINGLATKGFEQCEDQRGKPVMQRLQAL